jgi:Transglycosylase SLT domain
MRAASCVALAALVSSGAAAQSLTNGHGVPPQIVPLFQERGAPSFTVAPSGSGGAGLGGLGGGLTLRDPGDSSANVSAPAGSAMVALAATGYGDAAQAAASQAGINVESLAAIGQVESNFRNIGTANGSTSANGFWQITTPTWNGTVTRDGLGALDPSNPADQATVASNIVRDTAQTVSNATGHPATTLQVYGGYLFGPSYAGALATEADSTPLSAIIPAASLANNGMQNLTVGDFRTRMGAKLGETANRAVLVTGV